MTREWIVDNFLRWLLFILTWKWMLDITKQTTIAFVDLQIFKTIATSWLGIWTLHLSNTNALWRPGGSPWYFVIVDNDFNLISFLVSDDRIFDQQILYKKLDNHLDVINDNAKLHLYFKIDCISVLRVSSTPWQESE